MLKKNMLKGAVRLGKGFTMFISNEKMDDIIRVIESLKDSRVSINGVTGIVKHRVNKQEGWFCVPLWATKVALLIAPVASSLGRGVFGRVFMRMRRGYNNMDHIDKMF